MTAEQPGQKQDYAVWTPAVGEETMQRIMQDAAQGPAVIHGPAEISAIQQIPEQPIAGNSSGSKLPPVA